MDNNRASFIRGTILGMAIAIVVSAIIFVAVQTYAREVRWRGIDPNTKITEIFSLLERHSIIDFDQDYMLESMYRGLLDGVGCPYTVYFDHAALAAFHMRTEGAFVGIGVRFVIDPEDRLVTIVSAYAGAPAALAGLQPGDKIVGVDGVDVVGRPMEEVVGMILGDEGVPVALSILRPHENERFDVEIVRARVEIPTVFWEMLVNENGESIGYVRLDGFDRVTAGQFDAAVSQLYADGMDAIILDVRNNPGGLLSVVTHIANRLVPPGIITYTEDVNGRRNVSRSTGGYLGLPMAVLINGRSASASELLAGAIRDHEVGTLVGETTFGKGIVQNLYYLSDRTAIKITIAEYFTPLGTSIHGIGVAPHIEVELSEEIARQLGVIEHQYDAQLQEAIRVVSGKLR